MRYLARQLLHTIGLVSTVISSILISLSAGALPQMGLYEWLDCICVLGERITSRPVLSQFVCIACLALQAHVLGKKHFDVFFLKFGFPLPNTPGIRLMPVPSLSAASRHPKGGGQGTLHPCPSHHGNNAHGIDQPWGHIKKGADEFCHDLRAALASITEEVMLVVLQDMNFSGAT